MCTLCNGNATNITTTKEFPMEKIYRDKRTGFLLLIMAFIVLMVGIWNDAGLGLVIAIVLGVTGILFLIEGSK